MSRLRSRSAIALACMLTACVGHPVRPVPAVATVIAQQAQAARVSVLSAHPQWSLQGRVALSNGRNGGSGRIEWHQDGARYEVALSAPITRQGWRLSGDATSARLEGLDGGPREGVDASSLLHDATGWVIPVAALASWVRGHADAGLPAATLEFDAGGRLSRLQQAGWTIDYSDWLAEPALGIELPQHLNAARDDARVRLVVDNWREGPSTP